MSKISRIDYRLFLTRKIHFVTFDIYIQIELKD